MRSVPLAHSTVLQILINISKHFERAPGAHPLFFVSCLESVAQSLDDSSHFEELVANPEFFDGLKVICGQLIHGLQESKQGPAMTALV